MSIYKKAFSTICVIFLLSIATGFSQNILNKKISINIRQQRLDDALSIISNRADFSFSYNSNILKRDSLVTLNEGEYTVRQALKQLLGTGYEYKESGNYIILRLTALRVTSIVQLAPAADNTLTITGYIINGETGEKISNASIYEPMHLSSTLTDVNGKFSIKLKSKHKTASLAISKDSFEDTTVTIKPACNMQLEIALVPVVNIVIPSTTAVYQVADSVDYISLVDTTKALVIEKQKGVEQTRLARFLLSTKQITQSLNIQKFFTGKAVQVSLVPGLSTHSPLSSQVINKFSLNILGGYTGGVDLLEIGGLFNINRKNTQYMQVAGLFNVTGGNATGVQVAGISNHVQHNVTGVQVAGISNLTNGNLSGLQLAGIVNYNKGLLKGTQVSGIINYTKKLKGVQIGLINIADSSDGYSIGLINIILKGYHALSIFSNEVTNLNVAFKTGSRRMYSILQTGMDVDANNKKIYSFGYGLGTEINIRKWLSLNPELSSSHIYIGDWGYTNFLNRFNLQFNVKLNKKIALFAGPSFNVYYSNQPNAVEGYRFPITSAAAKSKMFRNEKLSGWFGWNVGINLF